jgi:hypothetical protein
VTGKIKEKYVRVIGKCHWWIYTQVGNHGPGIELKPGTEKLSVKNLILSTGSNRYIKSIKRIDQEISH